MAVRNIVLPLLGVVVVKAAHHFGLVGSNSLFQFVLMLQYAVPSAMSTSMTSCNLSYGCCNFPVVACFLLFFLLLETCFVLFGLRSCYKS